MKISEIRNLSNNELEAKLLEFKKELFNLRFQLSSGQLTNTSRIKHVKKIIAKIMTVLNQDHGVTKNA